MAGASFPVSGLCAVAMALSLDCCICRILYALLLLLLLLLALIRDLVDAVPIFDTCGVLCWRK